MNWVAWLHPGKTSEIQAHTGQDRTTCDDQIVLTWPRRDLIELRFVNTDNYAANVQSETRLPLFELTERQHRP